MKSEIRASTRLLLAVTTVLAGCTAASGPTWDAYSVVMPGNEKAYQVDCNGLLEGPSVCYQKAREICGQLPVRPVREVAGLERGSEGQRDVRSITFQCGAAPVPAVQPAQPAAPAVSPPTQVISLAGDANFDFDKATLTDEARRRLDRLVSEAKGIEFRSVAVSGHTDSIGTDQYNLALSQRRAESVAQYLKTSGLHARQITAQGYGKSNPIASNSTESGRAANRRVDIELNQER
ncbi:OmpA family protein [Paraburkholderia sp. BR14263]